MAEESYPKNAPGPFYVTNECCITCGIPVDIAPDVFSWDEKGPNDSHCFVRNQPSSADAIERTLKAMKAAEVDCIRYRGAGRKLRKELKRRGMAHLCDEPSE